MNKLLKIIDWGLAEFYFPNKSFNKWVSTRPYKPPEILLNILNYDMTFDLWNLGFILFCLIFKKKSLFIGKDNYEQLELLKKYFGSK